MEKLHVRKLKPIPPEEEIVISGIAGRFPDSNNMKHFQENLMNKIDLVTDDDRRWKLGRLINRFSRANFFIKIIFKFITEMLNLEFFYYCTYQFFYS